MAELINTRWFQNRLRDRHISQRQLADRLGTDPAAVSLMLRGKRKIQNTEAAQIANVLGLPLNEVLAHAGVKVPHHKGETVPVIGTVDAEGEIHARKVGARVPLPDEMPDDVVAVRVEDPDAVLYGWTYYYQARSGIDSDCMDRLCAVKLHNGGQLLRIIRRGFEIGAYNLTAPGMPPLTGARVMSATPVLWIKTA